MSASGRPSVRSIPRTARCSCGRWASVEVLEPRPPYAARVTLMCRACTKARGYELPAPLDWGIP